jgi:hypothetical protein
MAVQLLSVVGARKARGALLAADAGPYEQKLRVSAEVAQLRGDADDAMNSFAIGLGPHPQECGLAPLMNHPRDIGDFAAHDSAEYGSDTAQKAHRLDAVANDDTAWLQALEPHAVDFVP